ncbi:MAG: hypothetical protein AABX28_01785 [Nanoarchaeota archaeon]
MVYEIIKGREILKIWGKEIIMENREEENYCGKQIHIKKGMRTSLHFHKIKLETLFVIQGRILMEMRENGHGHLQEIVLEENQGIYIPRGTIHRIGGLAESVIIENSTYHRDSDSNRIEKNNYIPQEIMERYR